jgi:hypothetical protein
VTNKWSEEVIFTLEKKDWYMGTIENKPSNWDFTDASNDNTIEGFGTVTARARITIASDANANDVVTIIVKAYVGNGEPAETEIDVRVEGDYDLRFEPLEISEFDVNVGTEIFLSAFLELTNSAKVSDEVLLEAEWTTGGDDWDLNIAGGSSWKYFAAGETKKVYVSVKAPPDSEGDFTTLRITASSGGDGLEKDNVELHFRVAATSGGGGGSAASIDLISPSPAPEGSAIIFIGSGSDNGTAVAYLWESSIDGELSTEANFSSSDLSIGTHTITFRVQDNDGAWSDAAPASLFVGIAPIPKAGIDVKVEPNTEVQFTGSGTDEDGTIVNYEWDLNGDGVYDWSSTLNGITTHIYNGEGTYTAVLRLTDDDGFTATDSRVITVSKASDDAGDDDGFLPAPSLAASVAAVAVIALRRRR